MEIVGFKAASQFFLDREKVQKAVGKTMGRSFAKFGGLTRTVARRSIKKRTARRQVSQPGQPPLDRGTYRNTVLFIYDPAKKSVVIGPIKLAGKKSGAPRLLEYGGLGRTVSKDGKRTFIRQRPHMRPAFTVAIGKYPDLLRQSRTVGV